MMPRFTADKTAIASAVLALLLMAGHTGCEQGAPTPRSGAATTVAGPRRVMALGRIEPATGIVEISAIPGERLQRLAAGVEEGASVDAGMVLGQLASYRLRQTQLDAVLKRLDLAEAARDHEIAAADAQTNQAAATLAQARAKLEEVRAKEQQLENLEEAADIALEDLNRLKQLHQSDDELVTELELRRQRNAYHTARSDFEAAEAAYPHALKAAEEAVMAAERSHAFAVANAQQLREIDKNDAIRIEKTAAEQARDESLLKAPMTSGGPKSFSVLKIHMQPGEFVTQMPVMQIGNLDEMVCIAEVYEADAKEIFVGQEARIRSTAFEGAYGDLGEDGGIEGEVVRIGTLITNPGLMPRNPLAPSDRSVVEVVVAIKGDDEATDQAAQRIGLQVTVEFEKKQVDGEADESAADKSTDNRSTAEQPKSPEGEA